MIAVLDNDVDGLTCQQLSRFEEQFRYPLDADRSFVISHGLDYLRFFRGLGEPRCFVWREGKEIEGVLTTVLRKLLLPGLTRPVSALYLCDLKVLPGPRRGRTFLRLAQACRAYYASVGGLAVEVAYGLVMAGTQPSPEAYTGAWGVPRFTALAEVAILRIPVSSPLVGTARSCHPEEVRPLLARLESGGARAVWKGSGSGSRYEPIGLVHPSERACGVLEDTLQSKRLFTTDSELVSAHLSCFAYEHPNDGAAVVNSALQYCAQRQIPALFLALPASKLDEWQTLNDCPEATLTGATIYGLGMARGLDWNINTSEV